MGVPRPASSATERLHRRSEAGAPREEPELAEGTDTPLAKPLNLIVSLTASTPIRLIDEARHAGASSADIVEWRADFLQSESASESARIIEEIALALSGKPLLFTMRSPGEGGSTTLPAPARPAVAEAALASGHVDLVDIEVAQEDPLFAQLDHDARDMGLLRIGSRHLDITPSVAWMTDVLLEASERGYIPKLAVMAHTLADAARLLEATAAARAQGLLGPMITLAMGEVGRITRIVAPHFGSSAAFASVGQAAAPGQMPWDATERLLRALVAYGLLPFERVEGR